MTRFPSQQRSRNPSPPLALLVSATTPRHTIASYEPFSRFPYLLDLICDVLCAFLQMCFEKLEPLDSLCKFIDTTKGSIEMLFHLSFSNLTCIRDIGRIRTYSNGKAEQLRLHYSDGSLGNTMVSLQSENVIMAADFGASHWIPTCGSEQPPQERTPGCEAPGSCCLRSDSFLDQTLTPWFISESKFGSFLASDVFTATLNAFYIVFHGGTPIPGPDARSKFILEKLELLKTQDSALFDILILGLHPIAHPIQQHNGPTRLSSDELLHRLDAYRVSKQLESTPEYLRRLFGAAMRAKFESTLFDETTAAVDSAAPSFAKPANYSAIVSGLTRDPLVAKVLSGDSRSLWTFASEAPSPGESAIVAFDSVSGAQNDIMSAPSPKRRKAEDEQKATEQPLPFSFPATTSNIFLEAHKMTMNDHEKRRILAAYANSLAALPIDSRSNYVRDIFANTESSKIEVNDKNASEALVEISGVFKLALETLICPYEASDDKIEALIQRGLLLMPQKEVKFTPTSVRELFHPGNIGLTLATWAAAFGANVANGPIVFTSWRNLCKICTIDNAQLQHNAVFVAAAAGFLDLLKKQKGRSLFSL
jgi:hypothetical protein